MTRTDTLENFAEDLKAAAIARGAADPGPINPKYLDELITGVPILVDYGTLPVHISPLYTEQNGVGKIRLVFTNPPNSVGGKILMTEDGELPNLNSPILTEFEAAPNERKTFIVDELEPAKKYGFWALPKNTSEFYQTASDVRTKQIQDTVNYDPNSRIVELDLPGGLVSTAAEAIIKITQDGKVFLSSSSIVGIWKLEEDMTWTKVHSIGIWNVWYETSELFITSSNNQTPNRGILVWDESTQTFNQTISSTTPFNFINWFESTNNDIFTSAQTGTNTGVWKWNTSTKVFNQVLTVSVQYSRWFEDSEGNIYSSTGSTNGIYIYNPITNLFEVFINNAYINSTFITSTGRNFMLVRNNSSPINSVLYEISGAIATDVFPNITNNYNISWWFETMNGDIFFNSSTSILMLNSTLFEQAPISGSIRSGNSFFESSIGDFIIYDTGASSNSKAYYWNGFEFILVFENDELTAAARFISLTQITEINNVIIGYVPSGIQYKGTLRLNEARTNFIQISIINSSFGLFLTSDNYLYRFSAGADSSWRLINTNDPSWPNISLPTTTGNRWRFTELSNGDVYAICGSPSYANSRGVWKSTSANRVMTRINSDQKAIYFLCSIDNDQKVFFNNTTDSIIEIYDQTNFTTVLNQTIPANSEVIEETNRFVIIPTNNTPYVYIDKTTGEVTTDLIKTGGVIYRSNHEIYTINNSTNKLNNKDEAERNLINRFATAPVIEHDVYAVSRNNTTASILITVGDDL